MLGNGSRWGFVIGLATQPFWFYTSFRHRQWGIFIAILSPVPAFFGAGRHFPIDSDRDVLLGSCRVCRVEPPVALLASAGPLVPGNGNADMVWASRFVCGGDFLLRLASCQGKDLIAQAWRTAIAASRSQLSPRSLMAE